MASNYYRVLRTILFLHFAFAVPAAQAASPLCELSDKFTVNTLPQLNDLGVGKTIKDPEYVKRSATAILKLVHSKAKDPFPHWVMWAARDIVKKIGADPTNREVILPIADAVLMRFTKGDFSLLKSQDFSGILIAMFESPALRDQAAALTEPVVVAMREGRLDFTGNRLLNTAFTHFPSGPIRAQIVEYYRERFNRGDRNSFFHFTQANRKVKEFKDMPIALAIGPRLEKITEKTKATNYLEWDYLGFVRDAKAITLYRKNFAVMASNASAIHFEIGPQLKNIEETRTVLERIAAKGDAEVLRELGDLFAGFGGTPKLRNDADSMTSVELFWVLSNPQYRAKTTFYEDYRPISDSRMNQIRTTLGFP